MGAQAKLMIQVPQGFQQQLKNRAGARGQSLSDYIVDVLTEHAQQDAYADKLADKVWGELSEKSKDEGMLSVADSEALLARAKKSPNAPKTPASAD